MQGIVEFHGFKDNRNRFIVKEFTIVGKSYKTQLVFKPPYSFDLLNSKMKRTARWLTRHFHHIKWDEGDVLYNEEMIRDLCKPFEVIYTKGLEKAKFLREFHDNVLEIDESLHVNNSIEVDCIISQHKNKNCALRSAVSYARELFQAGLKNKNGPAAISTGRANPL